MSHSSILDEDTFSYKVLFILFLSTILNFYMMAYRLEINMVSKANTYRRDLVLNQLLVPVVISITAFINIIVPNAG